MEEKRILQKMLDEIWELHLLTVHDPAQMAELKQRAQAILPLNDTGFQAAQRLILGITPLAQRYLDLIFNRQENIVKRMMAMETINYLLMPFDLFPEQEMGFYGYLDDALLIMGMVRYLEDGVTQYDLTQLVEPFESDQQGILAQLTPFQRAGIYAQMNRIVKISVEFGATLPH